MTYLPGWVLFGSVGYVVGHYCGNGILGCAIAMIIASGLTAYHTK